jgi:hypothetical protein
MCGFFLDGNPANWAVNTVNDRVRLSVSRSTATIKPVVIIPHATKY